MRSAKRRVTKGRNNAELPATRDAQADATPNQDRTVPSTGKSKATGVKRRKPFVL